MTDVNWSDHLDSQIYWEVVIQVREVVDKMFMGDLDYSGIVIMANIMVCPYPNRSIASICSVTPSALYH